MVLYWCLGEILLVIFSRVQISKYNVHLTRGFSVAENHGRS